MFSATVDSHMSAEPLRVPQKEEAAPSAVDIIGFDTLQNGDSVAFETETRPVSKVHMREKAIPSTQIGRMMGFGSLGVRMAMGMAAENVVGAFSGSKSSSSSGYSLSDENAERLAETLCRMRGAALKIGQMLSVSEEGMLPPSLAKALDRVKQNADYMPLHQLNSQLAANLGSDWRSSFKEFIETPLAAASIGQVHRAVLLDGTEVAVKIQYPGVAKSIVSDLSNLKTLVTLTNLIPRGLFIDEIIRVASVELGEECDYRKEAAYQMRYRALVQEDKTVLSKYTYVPKVFEDLTTDMVITSEFVKGVSIDKSSVLPQDVRNAIARTMLVLTMREVFSWHFVQSDPNFANFLYDHNNKRVNLIDFGASRDYSKAFCDGYMELVWAAANKDRDTVLKVSIRLGFLTGDENKEMKDAHVDAALVVGEPFLTSDPYDFGNSTLTKKISQYGSTFMKYRLTPPPTEAYSLHRKLAGAFMLCIKLRAIIPCRDILESTYNNYPWETAKETTA